MNKVIVWLLGMSKAGKFVEKVRVALDGKKQMLAGLGTAIAGTLTILANFSKEDGGGLAYLAGVASTPEFLAASGGWIAFFNALNNSKVRAENAEIIEAVASVKTDTAETAAKVEELPPAA